MSAEMVNRVNFDRMRCCSQLASAAQDEPIFGDELEIFASPQQMCQLFLARNGKLLVIMMRHFNYGWIRIQSGVQVYERACENYIKSYNW